MEERVHSRKKQRAASRLAKVMARAAMAAAIVSCALSCTYDNLAPLKEDGLTLRLIVSVPGGSAATRSSVTGGETGPDNVGPEEQRRIDDAHVLVFDTDGRLLEVVEMTLFGGENTSNPQTYTGRVSTDVKMTAYMWVVANTGKNCPSVSLGDLLGKSREDVREELAYAYNYSLNEDGQTLSGWDISQYGLPMWGDVTDMSGESQITVDPQSGGGAMTLKSTLYRSVAKMGFSVDITQDEGKEYGDENFILKEVYVYFANAEGTVASAADREPDDNGRYLAPDVPASSAQFGKGNPIKYEVNGEDGIGNGERWLNRIFLAESDNKGASGEGETAPSGEGPVELTSGRRLVVVLGGIHAPAGVSDSNDLSYYRVDMAVDGQAFDIVRNHSYIFRITGVSAPGTSDPDPDRATDGLTVEVEDFEEEQMKGINSQYTLTVSRSAFSFSGQGSDLYTMEVNADGVDWEWDSGAKRVYYVVDGNTYYIVDNNGSPEIYKEDGSAAGTEFSYSESGKLIYYTYTDGGGISRRTLVNWLNVTEYPTNTNLQGRFDFAAEPNLNDDSFERSAYINITAGAIVKKIRFVQSRGATANAVVVTKAGDYYLNVTVRGNGRILDAEEEDINFGIDAAIEAEDIADVQIIWETAGGLVEIENDPDYLKATGCVKFKVNDRNLSEFGDWKGSVFDPGNGGNALIGAFDKDGKVLWSWHVWVIPDYADGVKTEIWTSGYEFMDRNLGAYSNLPGSASFGLLYQWGRKDPFIGAYRERRERDYHLVPKQYTVMYRHPVTGASFEWLDYDDDIWGSDDEKSILDFVIENPTVLLDDGLLSEKHNVEKAHGLWGQSTIDHTNYNMGDKTLWDPCPDGYRVPTLNALTIEDGHNDMWYSRTNNNMTEVQHSSYTSRYVPIKDGDSFRTQASYTANFVSDAPFYGFWLDYAGQHGFAGTYENAAGYGVNYYYDDMQEGSEALDQCGWMTGYSSSNPGKPGGVTWLPLAGIYNGSMDHFGRAGMTDRMGRGNEPYLPASSLQVTSVLWGNSPTSTNGNYPGGLLLHGTEGAYAPHYNNGNTTYQYSAGTAGGNGTGTPSTVATDGEGYWTTDTTGSSNTASGWWTGTTQDGLWNGAGDFPTPTKGVDGSWVYGDNWGDENGLEGSGRHFHSFADPAPSTLANPSYAASVRCIVDKDRLITISDDIYTDEAMTQKASSGAPRDLYQNVSVGAAGSTPHELDYYVYSMESWEVTNPGAKWVSVSPLSGNSSEEAGKTDILTIKYNTSVSESDAPKQGDEAKVSVQFLRGTVITFTIRYAGATLQQTTGTP